MFRNLGGDAAIIGAALAVALVGTLYGALLQNLIAGPVAVPLTVQGATVTSARMVIRCALPLVAGVTK